MAVREAVVDRRGEEVAQPLARDARQPGVRLAVLQARRRTEQHQAAHAFGRCHRQVLRHVAAGRVADDVRGLAAEVIQQFAHVLHQPIHRQRRLRRRHLRVAMAAQIHADHAVVAAQRRHRRIPALRRSHRGMQQQKRRRRSPRIGEVVDRVGDAVAVAGEEGFDIAGSVPPIPACHCEAAQRRSNPHHVAAHTATGDCRVAALLAMTGRRSCLAGAIPPAAASPCASRA